jgi:hypothetical protein
MQITPQKIVESSSTREFGQAAQRGPDSICHAVGDYGPLSLLKCP